MLKGIFTNYEIIGYAISAIIWFFALVLLLLVLKLITTIIAKFIDYLNDEERENQRIIDDLMKDPFASMLIQANIRERGDDDEANE